jgi:hypothetical protein
VREVHYSTRSEARNLHDGPIRRIHACIVVERTYWNKAHGGEKKEGQYFHIIHVSTPLHFISNFEHAHL